MHLLLCLYCRSSLGEVFSGKVSSGHVSPFQNHNSDQIVDPTWNKHIGPFSGVSSRSLCFCFVRLTVRHRRCSLKTEIEDFSRQTLSAHMRSHRGNAPLCVGQTEAVETFYTHAAVCLCLQSRGLSSVIILMAQWQWQELAMAAWIIAAIILSDVFEWAKSPLRAARPFCF